MNAEWVNKYREIISGRRLSVFATLIRGALYVVSVPYAWVMRLRNWLFDYGWKRTHKANVPVISVGNLTLGGTGKTPAVEWLARYYRDQGLRVAILSRGYGQTQERNDEALVLAENLPDVPHLQGKNRVALARIAETDLQSEILILDDGFQHRQLHRDLDVVLIDATEPWGYDYVFPRGGLREPKTRLKQAQVIAITRCDQVNLAQRQRVRQEIEQMAPGRAILETTHQPCCYHNSEGEELALSALRNRQVGAFCGIGNPEAFFRTVEQLGVTLINRRTYNDHHSYAEEDIATLCRWAHGLPKDASVLTTQKDLVKLRRKHLGNKPLWAVQIAWQLTVGEEELTKALERIRPTRIKPSERTSPKWVRRPDERQPEVRSF